MAEKRRVAGLGLHCEIAASQGIILRIYASDSTLERANSKSTSRNEILDLSEISSSLARMKVIIYKCLVSE